MAEDAGIADAASEPRLAGELIGHEAAEAELLEAWRAGRLHHAWLLQGPRGVGKATLAYRFARFLLAEDESGAAAARCGEGLAIDPASPVFHRIASGGHADLLVLEPDRDPKTGVPKREIGAENARRVDRFLALKPGEGRWRVVIVDTADAMNRHAANAVLKLLEEPPERAVFLLLSASPARLLPTIRSRCRRLALQPLLPAELDRVLRERLPDLSDEERAVLGRLARGCPGQALDLAGRGGLELQGRLSGLLDALPALDLPRLHALGDTLARSGAEADFRTVGELLADWLAGHAKAAGAERGELETWLGLWEKVGRLFADAERYSLDRKQVLLTAFAALQHAPRA